MVPSATATKKSASKKPATKKPAANKQTAASSSPTGAGSTYPGTVKYGDKGNAVRSYQTWLKKRVSPDLHVDGIYGNATFHCVMAWQRDHCNGRPVMDQAYPKGFMGEHMWHSLTKNV